MGVGITDSVNKLGQTLGDGERQGSLVCCSPWSCKESDTTEQLNKNNMKILFLVVKVFFEEKLC